MSEGACSFGGEIRAGLVAGIADGGMVIGSDFNGISPRSNSDSRGFGTAVIGGSAGCSTLGIKAVPTVRPPRSPGNTDGVSFTIVGEVEGALVGGASNGNSGGAADGGAAESLHPQPRRVPRRRVRRMMFSLDTLSP